MIFFSNMYFFSFDRGLMMMLVFMIKLYGIYYTYCYSLCNYYHIPNINKSVVTSYTSLCSCDELIMCARDILYLKEQKHMTSIAYQIACHPPMLVSLHIRHPPMLVSLHIRHSLMLVSLHIRHPPCWFHCI